MSKKNTGVPQSANDTQTKNKVTEQPKKKDNRWKEWLISLLITLVVLGIVVALQYWFAGTSGLGMNGTITWIGNIVGGIIMLFVVHHFVKKPKDDEYHP